MITGMLFGLAIAAAITYSTNIGMTNDRSVNLQKSYTRIVAGTLFCISIGGAIGRLIS